MPNTLNEFIEQKIEEWTNDSNGVTTVAFLRSALRECAEKTVEMVEQAKERHPMQNYEFQEGMASAIAHARAWLGTNDQPHA